MNCDLYLDGRVVGAVTGEPEGSRLRLTARCPFRGDGIYRVSLTGGSGALSLGVMMPAGEVMTARRSISRAELTQLGSPLRAEAVMSVSFGAVDAPADIPPAHSNPAPEGGWQPEPAPGHLFSDPWTAALWETAEDCLCRSGEGSTLLAVPVQPDTPFPPVPMFCLGQHRQLAGRDYLVFRISGTGEPVPPPEDMDK